MEYRESYIACAEQENEKEKTCKIHKLSRPELRIQQPKTKHFKLDGFIKNAFKINLSADIIIF